MHRGLENYVLMACSVVLKEIHARSRNWLVLFFCNSLSFDLFFALCEILQFSEPCFDLSSRLLLVIPKRVYVTKTDHLLRLLCMTLLLLLQQLRLLEKSSLMLVKFLEVDALEHRTQSSLRALLLFEDARLLNIPFLPDLSLEDAALTVVFLELSLTRLHATAHGHKRSIVFCNLYVRVIDYLLKF